MVKSYFAIFVFLLSSPSVARVFSFENESMAPYLNVRGGMSQMGSDPYAWQSASTYSGDEFGFIYGGEFGLYFRTMGIGIGVGILVDTFDPVEGVSAANASGTRLYSVTSEGISYGPTLTFDYQFAGEGGYLWKFVFGGGYQFAKLDNTYSMTATGQSLVGGQTQFSETLKAEFPFAMAGIGTEFVISGSSTLNILIGYHYALGDEWSYDGNGQNFAGSHGDGATVVFEDGSTKTIDWSYPFVQIGFNFYVDVIR